MPASPEPAVVPEPQPASLSDGAFGSTTGEPASPHDSMPVQPATTTTGAATVRLSLAAAGWPFLLVMALGAVGVIILLTGHWRRASLVIGAAGCAASVLRLLLPDRLQGLLKVRARWLDATLLAVAGVGIVVLSFIVPHTKLPG